MPYFDPSRPIPDSFMPFAFASAKTSGGRDLEESAAPDTALYTALLDSGRRAKSRTAALAQGRPRHPIRS